MGSAAGKGAVLGMGPWTVAALRPNLALPTPPASLAVNDWFWGGQAPVPTLIPWTWLTMPLELRADQPINHAEITRAGGATGIADALTSQTSFGVFAASGSSSTASSDDAANFARWLVAYYANPLTRCPTITIELAFRNTEERWRILGREIGDRITLTAGVVDGVSLPVPAGLPAGARDLVIEGIARSSSVVNATVYWTTAPLLGQTPGTEGPWFRLDYSAMDGTHVVPF